MEIFCSIRLVLEGRAGKEIQEFSEKFLINNFAWSNAEDNTSGLLNSGGKADLPLLRTLLVILQNSQEPSFWEVMDSFVLVAYASLAALRALLQWLLACLNFNTLDSGNILLVQVKKVISLNYGSSTSCWKEWRCVRFDLILMMRDIHQFQPKPTGKIHEQQQKHQSCHLDRSTWVAELPFLTTNATIHAYVSNILLFMALFWWKLLQVMESWGTQGTF